MSRKPDVIGRRIRVLPSLDASAEVQALVIDWNPYHRCHLVAMPVGSDPTDINARINVEVVDVEFLDRHRSSAASAKDLQPGDMVQWLDDRVWVITAQRDDNKLGMSTTRAYHSGLCLDEVAPWGFVDPGQWRSMPPDAIDRLAEDQLDAVAAVVFFGWAAGVGGVCPPGSSDIAAPLMYHSDLHAAMQIRVHDYLLVEERSDGLIIKLCRQGLAAESSVSGRAPTIQDWAAVWCRASIKLAQAIQGRPTLAEA